MRVGLLKYREFHEPILRPAFEALQGEHRCLLTSDESALIAFDPHVVIMGEAVAGRLRDVMPRALFIHTRHVSGPASSSTAFAEATR